MGQVIETPAEVRLEQSPLSEDERPRSAMAELIGQHPALFTFTIAFTVRALLAVFLTIVFGGSLVPDDSTYSMMATQVAAGERATWDAHTHELYRSTFAFLGPLSAIYSVVGPIKLVAQLFVALLGAFTAAATTLVALQFLKPRWAIAAGLTVALLPSQVLWSSLVLKDAAVWFALSALAVVVVIAARSTGLRLVSLGAGAAILLTMLAYLREHTFVVACFALALASVAGIAKQRIARVAGATLLAVSIPWLIGIGPAGLTLITDAGSLELRRMNNAEGARSAFVEPQSVEEEETNLARQIAALRAEAAKLRSRMGAGKGSGSAAGERELRARVAALEAQVAQLEAKLAEAGQESAGTAVEDSGAVDPHLRHLPTGLIAMLLEPVPWELGGSSALQLARLEALVWYPLLILGVIGLWISRKHLQALAFPLLAGGGMLFVYALTEGNVGTAFRHRGEFVWVVALLAALGLSQVAAWRQGRRAEMVETKGG